MFGLLGFALEADMDFRLTYGSVLFVR